MARVLQIAKELGAGQDAVVGIEKTSMRLILHDLQDDASGRLERFIETGEFVDREGALVHTFSAPRGEP